MEVDRVKVSLRYAQLLANGNWKTVEVEAEGTVSPKETWQQAQSYLYAELQRQVMEVFKLPEAKLEAATIRPAQPPPMRDPNDPEGLFDQRPPAQLDQPMGWPLQHREAPMGGQLQRREAPMGGQLQHWCVIHAQKFGQHRSQSGGQTWYSHKVEGTDDWCRE